MYQNIDLIFLSRLVEIKGIFLFLDALVSLCEDKTFNNELNIVIAGIPSPEFIERYSKYEKIFRNSKNIKINYCGLLSQEKKWELLHQSKNYILPTFGDSFGIAAIEALFSNVKVAASKRLGCSEILRNLKSFNYIELNKNSIKEDIKILLKNG